MTIQLKDPSLLKTQAYICGQWVDSDEGEIFPVYNPATLEQLAEVANVGLNETRRAIDGAQTAMETWRTIPAKNRSDILERWHNLLIENSEDLAVIMTAEQGKPLVESRGEIAYGASFIKWFAEEGKRVYGDIIPSTNDRRNIAIKQPIGVVAAITPWNFPNAMITRKVAPALVAGCAIVLKPAAETPLSALALVELANRAGLPSGLFSVVPTSDAVTVGSEMTSNPIVKKVTFTGSTQVGKLLMKQCADTVKRTSMELGGNAPIIIFDDADLDIAKGITGWSVKNPNKENSAGFIFMSNGHEPGSRKLLGKRYPPKGITQGRQMLRDLAMQPATAKYLCYKLAHHFVSDNPSPVLLAKMEDTWVKNQGNITKVMHALFDAEEAWIDGPQKYKTPREFVISAQRALALKKRNNKALLNSLINLGQEPYNAGSPAGFSDDEKDWLGASALMARIDWSMMVSGYLKRANAEKIMKLALGESVSNLTYQMVMRAESRQQALSLLLMSPEFQRR